MATEMLNAGIPLPVVARRLDRQRPSTTLNFYAQAVPGSDAHAAATLEAVLATSGRSPTSAAVEVGERMRHRALIPTSVADNAR